MSNYKVAIPSYNRSKRIVDKTLTTLRDNHIPFELVWVFVVPSEFDLYHTTITTAFPLFNPEHLIIGAKGLTAQRTFITNFFDEGEHILNLDDDVGEIDFSLSHYTDLDSFIKTAFSDCLKCGVFLWGVSTNHSVNWRTGQEHIRSGLTMIVGAFHGIINRKTLFTLTCNQKEDVERTIQHFIHDGNVLKYNRVGFKTNYYSVGGLGNKKSRFETNKIAAEKLFAMYPQYGFIKKRVRTDGRYDFCLKRLKGTDIEGLL